MNVLMDVPLALQERLSYIGPEEFVQAFVQKDPLDNNEVKCLGVFFYFECNFRTCVRAGKYQ